jgi:hypothetical protein
MSTSYQFDLLRTYRYLRLAMVLLVVLLFISVTMYINSEHGQMLQSISASYYTPVRAVFVSSLCAIGTCLIVYQGSTDVEDVLLNGSGFFAFIVGFVPTRPEENCVASAIPEDVRDAISNNVTALMVVAVLAFAIVMGIQLFATPASERALSKGAGAALAFSVLAFLGLAGYYLFNRDSFMCHGHNTAAILLFIGIVAVVFVSGRGLGHKQAREDGRPPRAHFWNRYFWGFVLMVASIAVIAVAGPWQGWLDHWVFWLEAALIAQFGLFWLTQTIELWREPRREDAPVAGA